MGKRKQQGESPGSLEDRPFKLITDNRALTWLHSAKDERAKLTRWAIMLSEHQFDIQHCSGKHNQLPDVLSRNPDTTEPAIGDQDDRMLVPSHQKPIALIMELANLHDVVKAAQRGDPDTQQTIAALTTPTMHQSRMRLNDNTSFRLLRAALNIIDHHTTSDHSLPT